MRAMRVVAFVVYFNSGLFSGKNKTKTQTTKKKIKHPVVCKWKKDMGCVILVCFKDGL